MNRPMVATIVDAPGAAPRMGTRPVPTPEAGQVRIRIIATALNFADLLMIEGRYQDMPPYPLIPGLEVAGVVDAVGSGVTGLSPGTRVAAETGQGGLAEYVAVDAARCLILPDSIDDNLAASFQIAYGTSHLALTRRARLQAGQSLAVLGAAGGVGLTAVEIGRAIGARVIAVARGADRLAVAKAAGADVLIDSDTEPDLRRALLSAGPLDVVYDAVGGAQGDAAQRALGPEGRHLLIGFASGTYPDLKPNHMLVKNIEVIGVYWGGYRRFNPTAVAESLTTLLDWHAAGRIHPHIGATFPLAQSTKALDVLRSRHVTGKIVVTQ